MSISVSSLFFSRLSSTQNFLKKNPKKVKNPKQKPKHKDKETFWVYILTNGFNFSFFGGGTI